MKKISLKIKVTLMFTFFMTLLTCISLGLLFSLSSQEILGSVQAQLEKRVYESMDEVSVQMVNWIWNRIFMIWRMAFTWLYMMKREPFSLGECLMVFRKRRCLQMGVCRLWEQAPRGGMFLISSIGRENFRTCISGVSVPLIVQKTV